MPKAKESYYLEEGRVIGIDQGYPMFGIAFAEDGELMDWSTVKMNHLKTKAEKRILYRERIKDWIIRYEPDMVVIERVRMFSKGTVAHKTMMTLSGLVISAGDVCFETGVPLFSVDTRSWKSRVVGSANATKEDTMAYLDELTGQVMQTEHEADAGCIALYPFTSKTIILKPED